jgi:hypothetical protein
MPPCQRRSALEFTRHTHGRKNCSVLCRLLDSSMNTFCATASLIYCVTGLRIWIFIPHMLPGSIDYIFRLSPHRFPPLEWPFLIFTKYKDMWMLLQPDESWSALGQSVASPRPRNVNAFFGRYEEILFFVYLACLLTDSQWHSTWRERITCVRHWRDSNLLIVWDSEMVHPIGSTLCIR